ncbi:arsenite methyltransferase isoform X1 [Gadus macrocephalus]|uniref:arsenite methyltransferase isoform X1 n=1 Tax=Gadus macrocephalus TaxID=80720 RepID=UPI0028CB4E20|nr:arsenite methyltransferase isoform X1 [Gadus macrocephalus]
MADTRCTQGFEDTATHVNVKEYYGKVLKKTVDLKTNACMTPSSPVPLHIRQALKMVHPEVSDKYYGCGLVVPESLQGCRVLDLGSGSGRDCYMLSQLVGEKGYVTGIDMTEDQLEVARTYVDYHMKEFGYKKPNVSFVQGYIEALKEAGIEDGSCDIIISNCVVNLSPDKKRVLEEAFRVLKDGGEFYFSDVYSSRRLTEELRRHQVLWGECISGALWWEDLLQLAGAVGFSAPRLVTAKPVTVDNSELQSILGDFRFVSATYRLFKVPAGARTPALVMYEGNVTGLEESFTLDTHYTFKVEEAVVVDGEVAEILSRSRFSDAFTVQRGALAPPGAAAPKTDVVNPFELSQRKENAVPGPATGGCCGAKSTACCK